MTDEDIESLLQKYRPAAPAPALRRRIVKTAGTRSYWAFLESMAALLLIGMNLSLIGASVTRLFPTDVPTDPARTQQLAAAITQLDLPLSTEDTQAMAQTLAAGEHLVQLPILHNQHPTPFTPNLGDTP